MDRIIISLAGSVILAVAGYLVIVFFILTDAVFPAWTMGVAAFVLFIIGLIYDIVTSRPEPQQDEE
jgi:hypothetical protein